VGLGISRQYEPTLSPLPEVVNELFAVVRDPQLQSSKGVVQGKILMNDDFTEDALKDYLSKAPPVVHIASHFVFNAGDDRGSFLLLAGEKKGGLGYELSLAELNGNKDLNFHGTALLALSACESGVGGMKQDGHEVDGLGTMSQLKGAQAVMASLWEVDDESTADLMGEFYTRWVEGAGRVEKAEALRQAQLQLLNGKILPKPDPRILDAPNNFTHPHYWAPFILMGNWK
jgi:CHAT domain-containing protein